MSKIKDYLAEVEGIDDLMPERKPSVDTIISAAVKFITSYGEDNYREFYEDAELDEDCDEMGRKSVYFANFEDICANIAQRGVEHIMEDWEVDMSIEDYNYACDKVKRIIAIEYAEWEDDVLAEIKGDIKERNAQRETYNSITLPH